MLPATPVAVRSCSPGGALTISMASRMAKKVIRTGASHRLIAGGLLPILRSGLLSAATRAMLSSRLVGRLVPLVPIMLPAWSKFIRIRPRWGKRYGPCASASFSTAGLAPVIFPVQLQRYLSGRRFRPRNERKVDRDRSRCGERCDGLRYIPGNVFPFTVLSH